jgi:hypothetical protein
LKRYLGDCKRTVTDLVANLQIVRTDAVITGGDCLGNLTEKPGFDFYAHDIGHPNIRSSP